MINELQKPLHDNESETLSCERPGLNKPETYVLTHIRFNTDLILIFSNLNNAQIYKIPHRDGPHHEIEIVISFSYLELFEPKENLGGYYTRKPND